jgi:peptide subunit release factor 1 (eRF1)
MRFGAKNMAEKNLQCGKENNPPVLADTLVTAAHQTSAKVTFIEDPTLLKEVGGVGALLRYRL